MIDLISSLFKEGDAIQIEYGNSNKRVKGTILKIMPSSIALKLDTGGITGISANEITSFDSPDVTVQESQTAIEPLSKDAKNDVTEQKEETKVLNNIEATKTDVTSKVPSYKPGDVIPLNELYKIDPKLKRTKKLSGSPKESVVTKQQTPSVPIAVEVKETKKRMSTIGNSFEALAPLVEEQHEIDNLKSVPAIGAISNLREDRNFGFIHDSKTGHHIYFSFNDVVGDLQIVLHKGVLFTEITNAEGYKAICVHKSGTVKDLLALSEDVAKKVK